MEIQIRLGTCVFQMTAVTPVRAHMDMGHVSMAGFPLIFHVLRPSSCSLPQQHKPFAPRVPERVGPCSHTEPGSVTPRAPAPHPGPAHPASNVRASAVRVRSSSAVPSNSTAASCQSTLPWASACLFKYTSLAPKPLFSPRRLQLFPYLPFSFPLASLRGISALAHPWY